MPPMPPEVPAVPNAVPLRLTFDRDDPGFSVISAEGELAMSSLFSIDVMLEHADPALVPNDFVARAVRLKLEGEPGTPEIRGIVRIFRQVSLEPAGVSRYAITLEPALCLLYKRRDCRIFKNLRVTDLVRAICARYAPILPPIRALDEASLPIHEYRAQYHRTDHDMVFQLLAEDGVASYFDFFDQTQLVLVPDTATQSPTPAVVLPFAASSSMSPPVHHVYAVELEAWTSTMMTTVRDHWVGRPDFDAEASATAAVGTVYDRYNFEPGSGRTKDELGAQAVSRLWERYTDSQSFFVLSTAFVAPGCRLQITGSPRVETEEELLVLETTSTWSAANDGGVPTAMHRLLCVKLSLRFAPERLPKRRISGLQKATVVGDGEIDTDELGRILCRFPWDREASISRRVLVSQGWAGGGYGLFTQPRVGDEVLIAYLDGDPDEPICVGRVHNGKNPTPVTLPRDKTVSLWRTRSSPGGDGFNEILLDDLAGEERFAIHAQRDFSSIALRDSTSDIGRHLTVRVAGNELNEITGHTSQYAGLTSTFGTKQFSVNASELMVLSGVNTEMVATTRNDQITGEFTVNAGKESHFVDGRFSASAPNVSLHGSEDVVLQSGGSMIVLKPGSIMLSIGGSTIVMTPGSIVVNSPLIDLNP